MTSVIVGLGEVGLALQKVLKCEGHDLAPLPEQHFDFLHICLPYSKKFDEAVAEYQFRYTPRTTVIHSTVPVGTARRLHAVHSPIHGIHPNLESGIRTFVKFIGATNEADAEEVARLYRSVGIKPYIVKNPETSELSKLGCTTRHGLMIIEEKLFKQRCDKEGADFSEAYTLWNELYTEGYVELGLPYVRRPIVKDMPGKIGGHCIVPNCSLIGGEVADFVLRENEKLV